MGDALEGVVLHQALDALRIGCEEVPRDAGPRRRRRVRTPKDREHHLGAVAQNARPHRVSGGASGRECRGRIGAPSPRDGAGEQRPKGHVWTPHGTSGNRQSFLLFPGTVDRGLSRMPDPLDASVGLSDQRPQDKFGCKFCEKRRRGVGIPLAPSGPQARHGTLITSVTQRGTVTRRWRGSAGFLEFG